MLFNGDSLILDEKTMDEVTMLNATEDFPKVESVSTRAANRRKKVEVRRRVEEILADRLYQAEYSDPFEELS